MCIYHAQDSLRPGVSVFLSDVETDPWSEGTLANMSTKCTRVLVTRGDQGADEYVQGQRVHHAAYHVCVFQMCCLLCVCSLLIQQHEFCHLIPQVANAVDTNGAGDTFAMAYVVASGWGAASPAAHANWAGSRAVLQPQECKPTCTGRQIRHVYGGWLRSSVWAAWYRVSGWCTTLAQLVVGRRRGLGHHAALH